MEPLRWRWIARDVRLHLMFDRVQYPFHPFHLCEYKSIQLLVYLSPSLSSLLKHPPISNSQILLFRAPQQDVLGQIPEATRFVQRGVGAGV